MQAALERVRESILACEILALFLVVCFSGSIVKLIHL